MRLEEEEAGGGGGEGGGGPGYRIKNKNPTQSCGELTSQRKSLVLPEPSFQECS